MTTFLSFTIPGLDPHACVRSGGRSRTRAYQGVVHRKTVDLELAVGGLDVQSELLLGIRHFDVESIFDRSREAVVDRGIVEFDVAAWEPRSTVDGTAIVGSTTFDGSTFTSSRSVVQATIAVAAAAIVNIFNNFFMSEVFLLYLYC